MKEPDTRSVLSAVVTHQLSDCNCMNKDSCFLLTCRMLQINDEIDIRGLRRRSPRADVSADVFINLLGQNVMNCKEIRIQFLPNYIDIYITFRTKI